MLDNTLCIIEHFGNADTVPQPPERCLSRKAGIVRCCLRKGKEELRMNQQGSQKIDAYRRASNYPAAGQLYLPDPPLLRRPLKPEDVKRKLIAHKNCIHEIGQDMPEILDRKWHLPEKVYTF